MASADDFTDPPTEDPMVLLERDAPIHDRIAAIGASNQSLDALRTVARDTASPGVVRAAAILAIADRDEPLDLDTDGDPAVAAAVATVRLHASARDAIEATARGETVALPSAAMLAPPVRGKPLERLGLDASQASRAIEAVRPELRAATPVVSGALRCGESDIAVVTALQRLHRETSSASRPIWVVVVHHHRRDRHMDRAVRGTHTTRSRRRCRVGHRSARRGPLRRARGACRGPPRIRLHAADRPGATPVEVIARIDADGVHLDGVTATGGANRLIPAPDRELRR